MKLAYGKRYRRRDRQITAALVPSANVNYPFYDPLHKISYSEAGQYYINGTDALDLVSEYIGT